MPTYDRMFHVELRQFPHTAREFNLEADDLQSRIVRPWLAGRTVELGERKWAPERARLTIYEGPRLPPEDLGIGRGWANVTRSGENVTTRLLEPPATGQVAALAQLKQAVLDRCADRRIEIRETVELASVHAAGTRASERLALAEQAVWELLHTGAIRLTRDGSPIDAAEWQPVLLAWTTWSGPQSLELERP